MRNLFKWRKKEKSPGAQVQAVITVQPPVLNPSSGQQIEFAKWRAEHIARWLTDPVNADHHQRSLIEAERDMHLSMLRMCGHDV